MNISRYEAASLYDFNITHEDAYYLVLDFDDCSYGFCRCDNQGKTELVHSWTSINTDLWKLCIEAVKEKIGNDCPFDITRELQSQLASSKDIFYNYIISDRLMDLEVLHFSGYSISCQEFEEMLCGVKTKLEELFLQIKKQLNTEDYLNSKVILLGRAQMIFLLTYYVKEFLSAEPLLPRFRNEELKDSFDKAVEIGMELNASRHAVQQTYSLVIYNKDTNSNEELLTLKKGQSWDSLQNVDYIGPVLLTKSDSLKIKMDETVANVEVPYFFEPLESDLVDLGFGIQSNQIVLNIRRCRFPTRIYPVPLE